MKIQFIIGTHPNESFSTVVAQHAARELRKHGIEVVLTPYPLSKTQLGNIFRKGKLLNKANDMQYFTERTIINLLRSQNADLIFNFHSTGDNEEWKINRGKPAEIDYDIRPAESATSLLRIRGLETPEKPNLLHKPNEFLVEVRAAVRPFPKKVAERRIRAIWGDPRLQDKNTNQHLIEGTSIEKTATELGLHARTLGLAIAKSIRTEIPKLKPYDIIRAGVPHRAITAAQWEARNKRRAHLLRMMKKRQMPKRAP